jgi:hypothetical protein
VIACYGAALPLWLTLPHEWAAAGGALGLVGCIVELAGVRRARTLTWHADGYWSEDAGARRLEGLRLAASSFVSRGLVVLVLKDAAGRARHRVVARDGVDSGTWRRLQARLRVEGGPLAAPDAGWKSVRGEP